MNDGLFPPIAPVFASTRQDAPDQLTALQNDPNAEATRARAARCAGGESPVAIMNHFARELMDTGYLHNHARMWFAAWLAFTSMIRRSSARIR
jgi:deoxyribodipyrimidine photolyase